MAGGVLILAVAAIFYLVLQGTVFAPTDTNGAEVSHLTVPSKAVGENLDVAVIVPAGDATEERPLLVFLHGRGEAGDDYTSNEAVFSALTRLGDKAPIIAFPDGGDDSYWHDRAEGNWGDYVVGEVVPQVSREFDADPNRVAIGGISMGGFGAYNLALQNPERFCAVGGHSPALWLEGGDSAAGAFDDAEDFARNDVIAAVRADPNAFGSIPIWNDAGEEDPFLISDVAFASALREGSAELTAHTWPGGHDHSYWGRNWNAYLRFYAEALARCG